MPWELSAVLEKDVLEAGMRALIEEDAAHEVPLENLSDFQQVAYLESVRYMRNQLLRDTDWVSMAHSLEIRVPLVDSKLTEAIASLAVHGRLEKADLPKTLANPLPAFITKRPKTGFTTPTWRWLRHYPGLDAWRTIPFLNQSHVRDSRRWAYTLLHRVPEAQQILK
jgi:asparagine synthase (glutamine-hydrolysing)